MREQDQAAESPLAREARTTGDALAKLVDLARIGAGRVKGVELQRRVLAWGGDAGVAEEVCHAGGPYPFPCRRSWMRA